MKRLLPCLALASLCCGKGRATPNWTQDVEPLVQQSCDGCHGYDGIAPMGLNSYLKAKLHGAQMATTVASHVMPPWPPSTEGVPLKGSRALAADQIRLIQDWVTAGMPEGPQSAHGELQPKVVHMNNNLSVAMKEPYTPEEGLTDDYRCFVIDPQVGTTQSITGYDIKPGTPGNVHHVILFEVLNQQGAVESVKALDGADGRPGYTCFGGPMLDTTQSGPDGLPPYRLVGGWAPGQGATLMPPHTGIKLEAGAVLLMQVHYNELNGRNPDLTTAQLQLTPKTPDIQDALLVPIVDQRFHIKAGDAHYTHGQSFTLPAFIPKATIHAVYPHMHLLGTQISLSTKHAGVETLLINVPNWDFHWQGSYELLNPVTVVPGDELSVSCTWDNSAAHQPSLRGVQGPPRTDEMCLGFLYVTF
jgi:hypothetical protein